MSNQSDSRERILGSIRQAIKINPNLHSRPKHIRLPQANFDESYFRAQLVTAQAIVLEASVDQQIPDLVAKLCRQRSLPCKVAVAEGELTKLDWKTAGIEMCDKLEKEISVSVTGCDGAIAETGQIMVTNRKQDAWLSLVAEVHVAVVNLSKLYSSLDELADIIGANPPSTTVLICGPSRTADIEQTLVMGAHGPREVCAILLDNSTTDNKNNSQTD